jgi:hypothetical protein
LTSKLYVIKLIKPLTAVIIGILMALYSLSSYAQSLLDREVTLNYREARIDDILNELSRQGHFYFSYEGGLLPKDSVVTVAFQNQSVLAVLAHLFHDRYAYQQRKNYLIIMPQLRKLSLINADLTDDKNNSSISGLVTDERTGERLMNASVYEKQQLVATLTDEHGYFRLKLKRGTESIRVTVSKLNYKDTSVNFLQPVSVNSRRDEEFYTNAKKRSNRIERTGLAGLFISARQKIQSLNISDFLATRPFQVSLTPGLSTHGNLSPQVVNSFSLNLAGGYTAGVNGLEVGGIFNINKEHSRYLQLAGVFNLVGGNMVGLQLAGAYNLALDTLKGAQISLFANKSDAQVSGLQLSALHNETRHLKGVQIGLVNKADISEGISIGLLNITHNGFYRVAYSANSLAHTNISLKTGTHAFYTALLLSANPSVHNKFYAFGLGIGHDLMLSDRVYLSAEAAYQFANTGLWDDRWAQGKMLLNVQLAKNISLFGGATYNKYSYTGSQPGYQERFRLPGGAYANGYLRNPVQRWVGWEAGLTFNSTFKPVKRNFDQSSAWYLGFAGTTGIGWDEPYKFVSGGEFSVQRDLPGKLTGTLTTGYTHISVRPEARLRQNGDLWADQKPVRIIPVKAGIRIRTNGLFYFAGDIGAAFGTASAASGYANTGTLMDHWFRSLMYSVSGGVCFRSGIEAGIKFEDYGLQSRYKQFALRLGYRLKLSK